MKDALGNELKHGDLVMVQLKQPWLHGRIVEASEGGLVVQGMSQAGKIVVASTHIAFADQSGVCAMIVALREDSSDEADKNARPN